MPRLYHKLARTCTVALSLLLTAAGPPHLASHRRFPTSPLSAEAVAISLYGPCGGFSYRNTDNPRGIVLGLDPSGLVVTPSPFDLQREATAQACPGTGFDLVAGELFGQHIAENTADPYILAGYRVNLGAWTLSAEAGLIYDRFNNRRHHPQFTFSVAGIYPFVGVEGRVRW